MKINEIKITKHNNKIKVSAFCNVRRFGIDELYFIFDKKYEKYLMADASAFAACLLIPSMKLGEDLIIKGSISSELYKGMFEIMNTMLAWNYGDLKPINILPDEIRPDTQQSKFAASFFSGGVDAFYTYIKNKKNKLPLTHFILVNGFDIDLRNKKLWEAIRDNTRSIAKKEKINLIEVETNMHDLLEPILLWEYTFGSAMAAIALLLRNQLKRVYIASSYTFEQVFPSGSHPAIDKFWSTERLNIVHDGAEASRIKKTKKIANFPIVLNNLRVCYLNIRNTYNCGKCDKCLRTMIGLQIAGKLHKSKTFPRTINPELVAALPIEAEHGAIFHRENLSELKKQKIEPQLQQAVESALSRVFSSPSHPLPPFIYKSIFIDHMYNRGRIYKVVSKLRNKYKK